MIQTYKLAFVRLKYSQPSSTFLRHQVMHGRVAMLACVGYLAGESTGGPFGLSGPANDQLAQMPLPAFAVLTLLIGVAETYRATVGWVEPGLKSLWTLRDSYYPGDVGFDPLGLKPTDAREFQASLAFVLYNILPVFLRSYLCGPSFKYCDPCLLIPYTHVSLNRRSCKPKSSKMGGLR